MAVRFPFSWSRWFWPALAYGLLLLTLALGAYFIYLEREVRVAFDGKRWALPTKVYARPLIMRPGTPLSAAQLQYELNHLGYRLSAESRAGSPLSGTYQQTDTTFTITARAFRFVEGAQPARTFQVTLQNNRVTALRGPQQQPLAQAALDPLPIGGIYPHSQEDRLLLRAADTSPLLIKTLLAIEDRSFYNHAGVSPWAIARALWVDVTQGEMVQGGSTLTQQLAKNFFLSNERTLKRKLKEAAIALILEWRYSKTEILEAYCNEIFLGQNGAHAIHGFAMGSWFYFQRPIADLRPQEIALLVGLIKGPSLFDPRRQPQRALARRNVVLRVMAEDGLLRRDEHQAALRQPLGVVSTPPTSLSPYPAFLDLVRRQLTQYYADEDLRSAGLQIITTLDPWAQQQTEQAIAARLPRLETPGQKLEVAAILAQPSSGEIRALVGDRNPRYAGFNRALDAARPVGSLIKPVVYLAALQQADRYTLATLLDDSPISLPQKGGRLWTPANYDHEAHGAVTLTQALAQSYNLATVRLGLDLGLPTVTRLIKNLGVSRRLNPYPSLLLGATAMTPWEITQIYQTLANGGVRVAPHAIAAVLDAQGRPLRRHRAKPVQVVTPAQAFVLTHALRAVMSSGTGAGVSARLPAHWRVAGKTGTTDDLRDSWFAGFTPDRLAVVWIGRDNNQPTRLSGAAGALPVWTDIFTALGPPAALPQVPAGIEWAWTARDTGQIVAEDCPGAIATPFIAGSAPSISTSCSGFPRALEILTH